MNLYLEVNNGECSLYLSFYIIILRIFKKLQYSLYCYANPLFEFVSGISIYYFKKILYHRLINIYMLLII